VWVVLLLRERYPANKQMGDGGQGMVLMTVTPVAGWGQEGMHPGRMTSVRETGRHSGTQRHQRAGTASSRKRARSHSCRPRRPLSPFLGGPKAMRQPALHTDMGR
jgi:hypothetical protein